MLKSEIIKVNEKLEKDILSRLPKKYSNLEKAIFIYYELCKKLNYSLDYFLNRNLVSDFFVNVDNLKYVNGETNSDVVCFTFNAILAKILYDAKICDENPLNQIHFFEDGLLSDWHDDLRLVIDGEKFSVDATLGVLDNNDLTLSKYSTYLLDGWEPAPRLHEEKAFDKITKKINNAIKKVQSENQTINNNVSEYLRAKTLDNSYEELPLDDRVKMFMSALTFTPKYSILSFNYLLKLKHKIFTASEQGINEQFKSNIDLIFLKNKFNEYEAFLFYNQKGYIPDLGYENFDALKIWRVSIKNKTLENLDLNEFKTLISKNVVNLRDNLDVEFERCFAFPASPHITPVYKKQKLVGYKRIYLIDGHTEDLSIPEGEKLLQLTKITNICERENEFSKIMECKKWKI